MNSRDLILRSIRKGNHVGGAAGIKQHEIARPSASYRDSSQLSHEARIALLIDRLQDYGARVLRTTPEAVPQSINRLVEARGASRMVMPPGIPAAWLPQSSYFTEDAALSPAELNTFDGVLTTATLAIAQTGTIVLQNAPGQGRRALSLVPDYYLCLLRTDQVVETVPEAFAQLAPTATLPTTFISGPSATADIEMTRIKGVHGPRTLDVLLIET